MFNPFKKKDEFKLDDIKLPSLNDTPDDNFSLPSLDNNNDTNSLGGIDNNPTNTMPTSDPLGSNTPSPDLNSNPFNNPSNSSSFDGSSIQPQNDFNPNINPMLQPNTSADTNSNIDNSQHQEITKAQIETIISKITLLDARQQNMEQKIDLIYQILLNEISEDTKRKLNIDSMMNSIRK